MHSRIILMCIYYFGLHIKAKIKFVWSRINGELYSFSYLKMFFSFKKKKKVGLFGDHHVLCDHGRGFGFLFRLANVSRLSSPQICGRHSWTQNHRHSHHFLCEKLEQRHHPHSLYVGCICLIGIASKNYFAYLMYINIFHRLRLVHLLIGNVISILFSKLQIILCTFLKINVLISMF